LQNLVVLLIVFETFWGFWRHVTTNIRATCIPPIFKTRAAEPSARAGHFARSRSSV